MKQRVGRGWKPIMFANDPTHVVVFPPQQPIRSDWNVLYCHPVFILLRPRHIKRSWVVVGNVSSMHTINSIQKLSNLVCRRPDSLCTQKH